MTLQIKKQRIAKKKKKVTLVKSIITIKVTFSSELIGFWRVIWCMKIALVL